MNSPAPPDNQCYVVLGNGTKIAKRENRQWVSIHPNWTVTGDVDSIEVEFHPNVNN